MTVLLPGSQSVREALTKFHRRKEFPATFTLDTDGLRSKINRFLKPKSDTTEPPILAEYWQGPGGREACKRWITELHETEYRDGFALTWRLGTDNINYASKYSICWAPERLVRLLGRNEMSRKKDDTHDLPRGVVRGGGGYYYRDLDRKAHYSNCPNALHKKFLEDRRNYMLEVFNSDIGPHLTILLRIRIERLRHAIDNGINLEYL